MTTASYAVEGLTCGSCVAEVLENVHLLSGVTDVAVDLVTGGRSALVVTSGTTLEPETVRRAVENAGFDLAAAEGLGLRRLWDSPFRQDDVTEPVREQRCLLSEV